MSNVQLLDDYLGHKQELLKALNSSDKTDQSFIKSLDKLCRSRSRFYISCKDLPDIDLDIDLLPKGNFKYCLNQIDLTLSDEDIKTIYDVIILFIKRRKIMT